ncbi:uncharacterized protein B0T23DRAFT_53979 [Neurospora hispaniola]|uniref:Uncharacterized protein n=1 Tax=Neurospora hispaniola TaxID=588809 RepID=A0AAJ0MLP0_9PEZI|nr:hypothetical protein B0T23DRAFT_53979 [Neurospora hispaniola]
MTTPWGMRLGSMDRGRTREGTTPFALLNCRMSSDGSTGHRDTLIQGKKKTAALSSTHKRVACPMCGDGPEFQYQVPAPGFQKKIQLVALHWLLWLLPQFLAPSTTSTHFSILWAMPIHCLLHAAIGKPHRTQNPPLSRPLLPSTASHPATHQDPFSNPTPTLSWRRRRSFLDAVRNTGPRQDSQANESRETCLPDRGYHCVKAVSLASLWASNA